MNHSFKKAILQNTFAYVKLQAAAYMHRVAAELSVTARTCKDIWVCKSFTKLGLWGMNCAVRPSVSVHGSKSGHSDGNLEQQI